MTLMLIIRHVYNKPIFFFNGKGRGYFFIIEKYYVLISSYHDKVTIVC